MLARAAQSGGENVTLSSLSTPQVTSVRSSVLMVENRDTTDLSSAQICQALAGLYVEFGAALALQPSHEYKIIIIVLPLQSMLSCSTWKDWCFLLYYVVFYTLGQH